MQTLKSKTMAILISVLMAISIGGSLTLASAHTPPLSIPTFSFISVSPNPCGVGQTLRVNFWVNEPPPTASAQYGDRWHNMTVIVTKPDGTTTTLGPFSSDDTGGTSTGYTPDQTGNYSFVFKFGGDTITDENPSGGAGSPHDVYYGDYYQPSQSSVVTVTIQSAPIQAPPITPLPSTFWTRPIYAENNNWYVIAGPWLGQAASTFAATGMYNSTGNYNPYTTAPMTGHVLWTVPEAWGGTIGGQYGGSETGNYYSTSQYEPKFAPIIMQGVLYFTNYPGASTYPEGWVALDLHTGKVVWQMTESQARNDVLFCGQILNEITPNQYGAESYLWAEPIASSGFMAAGSSLDMFDAMTGQYILTISGTQTMTLAQDITAT